MSGLEGTPLGNWAEKEINKKPEIEDIEFNFLKIKIDRRRNDQIIELHVKGASDPTNFLVKDNKIISGDIEHYGTEIDTKSDNELLRAHAKTIETLIRENRI